jgi:hypothetical protein
MSMKNARTSASAVLLLSWSLTASARSGGAQQPGATPRTPTELTVIGCIMRIDTSALRPGTTDTGETRSAQKGTPSGFVLKDAAVATASTSTKGPVATKSEREFQLVKTDVPFEKFAGHQVEAKGRLGSGDASRDAGSGGSSAAAGGSSASGDRQGQLPETAGSYQNVLHVTSLRSLSGTCPPPGGGR